MARKSRKNLEPTNATHNSAVVYKTAIYARISVETDEKIETDTIGTQIKLLEDYVTQSTDLKVFDVYCDDDMTGTNFQRPEFSRMMNDIRDGKVDCVLVKDLSRLGRNFLESGEYIEKVFPFLGVRFIAVNDQVDTLYKPADIGVQLKNMVNEMYAKDISKKICSTVKVMQEQGKFIGSHPPYGYRRKETDKYSLEIDPETAPVVKEMFRKILEGYTLHSIALEFNERGVPSPGRYKYEKGFLKHEKYKNSVWFFSTVRRMLSDRTYLGWIQSGKFQTKNILGKEKLIKKPEDEWIVNKNMHEPIIEEAVFWQVQNILRVKQKGSNIGKYASKGNVNNIFRGKLKCGECGKSMALRKKKNGDQIQYWYICPMHEHYNSMYCTKKSVKKEYFDELVLNLIRKQMKLFIDAKTLLQNLNRSESSKNKYQIYLNQINKTEKQIADSMKMKVELYSDFAEGIISEDKYHRVLIEYNQKVEELKIFLKELKKDAEKYSPECGCLEKWEIFVKEYMNKEQLDRKMVEAFIDSITLYNDSRVEIVFNYGDELEHVLFLAMERKGEAVKYA